MLRLTLVALLLASCLFPFVSPVQAKEAHLTLSPARLPAPALRYPLLPELREQMPGNAAPLYRKASSLLEDKKQRAELRGLLNLWVLPLSELPRKEMQQSLELYKEVLDLLETAACREGCDWGLAEQLRRDGGYAPLLQGMGQLYMAGLLLCARARLELLHDEPEKALRTLQSAYVLGRRLGSAPSLANFDSAANLLAQVNEGLEEVIAHPKAPNLYWSLTNLPRPFLDVRKPLEGQRLAAYGVIPGLWEIATRRDARLTDEELLSAHTWLFKLQEEVPPQTPGLVPGLARVQLLVQQQIPQIQRFRRNYALATIIQRKHATARRVLLEHGWPRDWVESLPPLYAAFLHGAAEFDQHLDELACWQGVPYWQALSALVEFERRRESLRRRPAAQKPAAPVAELFLPDAFALYDPPVRLEQRFAALRCLEALRLYAALHGGKLPASLQDIKEVPIPVDPVTGNPFVYERSGETASLKTPRISGDTVDSLSYKVTIRR